MFKNDRNFTIIYYLLKIINLYICLGANSNFVPGSYLVRYQRVLFLGPGVYSIHKCSKHKKTRPVFLLGLWSGGFTLRV